MQFTACYTKLEGGSYKGMLLEWPEVMTFGKDLEDCQNMLIDAAQVMALCYRDDNKDIPNPPVIIKPLSIPLDDESLNAYEQMVEEMIARGEISRCDNEDEEDEEAEALLAHVG